MAEEAQIEIQIVWTACWLGQTACHWDKPSTNVDKQSRIFSTEGRLVEGFFLRTVC